MGSRLRRACWQHWARRLPTVTSRRMWSRARTSSARASWRRTRSMLRTMKTTTSMASRRTSPGCARTRVWTPSQASSQCPSRWRSRKSRSASASPTSRQKSSAPGAAASWTAWRRRSPRRKPCQMPTASPPWGSPRSASTSSSGPLQRGWVQWQTQRTPTSTSWACRSGCVSSLPWRKSRRSSSGTRSANSCTACTRRRMRWGS
mmetsp:Transcript_13820/g.43752  ORF Transcript_13820/g.43752 Transcript_13820/m.43752 type:complete len:204 (+) Transcript_13820:232-843(+)